MNLQIKRVYDHASPADGKRILIDRLWPRGLTKEVANITLWIKDIAPSTELRQWYDHDPAKWPEFKKRYQSELKRNQASLKKLLEELTGTVTLLYAAKDEEHNNAVVLQEYIYTL